MSERKEGNLEAPTRHPIRWRDEDWWSEDNLFASTTSVMDVGGV
jgi:glycerol-3-phosphate dehydrogenase subunit C